MMNKEQINLGEVVMNFVNPTYCWRLLSLVVGFTTWEIYGRFASSMAVPPFSDVVVAFFRILFDGSLASAYAITLKPLLVGLGLAAVLGISYGILMGLSKKLEWFTIVLFVALQAAPMAAIIPLITFLYGIGFLAKTIAVIVLAAPGIVLNTYRGVRNVSESLVEMSEVFLASKWEQISKVIIPAASGMLIASLRMGVAAGFVGIILAEFLITPTGLGALINHTQVMAEYAQMYATIVSLILLSAISISILQWVENRYFRF